MKTATTQLLIAGVLFVSSPVTLYGASLGSDVQLTQSTPAAGQVVVQANLIKPRLYWATALLGLGQVGAAIWLLLTLPTQAKAQELGEEDQSNDLLTEPEPALAENQTITAPPPSPLPNTPGTVGVDQWMRQQGVQSHPAWGQGQTPVDENEVPVIDRRRVKSTVR